MPGLQHALALRKDRDQCARERFTSSMRAWVLTDLAAQMQDDYNQAYEACGTSHDSGCLLYTSPSPRDLSTSRMPSSA